MTRRAVHQRQNNSRWIKTPLRQRGCAGLMDESLKCGAQKVDALVDFVGVIGRKREAHGLAVGAR